MSYITPILRALRPTKTTDSLTRRRSSSTQWGLRTALPRKSTWRRWPFSFFISILLHENVFTTSFHELHFWHWHNSKFVRVTLKMNQNSIVFWKRCNQVKLDVLKPWITKRTTELLKMEDDVVVEFIFNQLEEKVRHCSGRWNSFASWLLETTKYVYAMLWSDKRWGI